MTIGALAVIALGAVVFWIDRRERRRELRAAHLAARLYDAEVLRGLGYQCATDSQIRRAPSQPILDDCEWNEVLHKLLQATAHTTGIDVDVDA